MKKIFITLLVLFSTSYGFTQNVTFIQPPTQTSPGMCYGGNQTVTASTQNATGFLVQVLNSQNNWENYPGAEGLISTNPGAISYTFYGISYAFAFRIRIFNATDTLNSGPQTITPNRPEFQFHPADLMQCTGNAVKFYASATGNCNISYQWYRFDGSTNHVLTNGSVYSGVGTNGLGISSVASSQHNYQFLVKATDPNGCENYSQTGKLTVNQLSTVVSPTTTQQYCEGDTVTFSVATKIGEVSSQNWMKKFGSEPVYTNITPSTHFSDPTGDILKVFGIKSTENNYRLRVNFVVKNQNADGSISTSICTKDATRASYVINPRPQKPSPIADLERCGSGKVTYTISQPGNYYWYTDTTKNAIINNQSHFTSPSIDSTRAFYVSQKDLKGCESHKTSFWALIRNIPELFLTKNFTFCPTNNQFELNFDSTKHDPEKIYVKNGSASFPGFVEVIETPFSNPISITLPGNISPEIYNLQLFAKNQYCFSDTTILNFEVKTPVKITNSPINTNLCEGEDHTFSVDYTGDGPFSYQWLKNGSLIVGEAGKTLAINDIKAGDAGDYKVIVQGFCGNDTALIGSVEVLRPTFIQTQPKPVKVCENENAVFKVEATGSGTLHYQWYQNDLPVGGDSSTLRIESVHITQNQSIIKCRIISDCGAGIFSEPVILTVVQLPATPTINDRIGFCQSENWANLTATALPFHSLIWYDGDRNMLASNQIPAAIPGVKNYFVCQIDSNNCQSPLKPFEVEITERFEIESISDKSFICPTGNFNNQVLLSQRLSPENQPVEKYTLFLNDHFVSENTVGEFIGNSAGKYTVTAQYHFCQISDSVSVHSLFPELTTSPSASDTSVCLNNSVALQVNSEYQNGTYYWWESENSVFSNFQGNTFTTNPIIENTKFYVSYVKQNNENRVCESTRKEIKVNIRQNLSPDITVSDVKCIGQSDGKIIIEANSIAPPVQFTLNNSIQNITGVFENLDAGSYSILMQDTEGCKIDTSIIIDTAPGPEYLIQPETISRCKGNNASFSFSANNYNSIIWQKKLPGGLDFSDIPGSNATNLNLTNIGNAVYPHNTIFRAKISNGVCEITSREAILKVNSVSSSNKTISFCENSMAQLDLTGIEITGKVSAYLWEKRNGTSGPWNSIPNSNDSVFVFNNISRNDAAYYRAKLTFDNGNENSCIINTTTTTGLRVLVDTLQVPILSDDVSICSGNSTVLSVSNCSGNILWSTGQTQNSITVSPHLTSKYAVTCIYNTCTTNSADSITVTVLDNNNLAPVISTGKLNYCKGDSIFLYASGCENQTVWSNEMTGDTLKLKAINSFSISAHCLSKGCSSPTSNSINISVLPQISAGMIQDYTQTNCAGFNPTTINSLTNPTGGTIQWQFSENCSAVSPVWVDISGAHTTTYNPPALNVTTCFRRMVFDSCQTAFSNVLTFHIVPDPVVSVSSDLPEVCFGNSVLLSKNIIGGQGTCPVQWQINKVSGAASSAFWQNYALGDSLEIPNQNIGSDSTWYFRVKVDCDNSSCNLAVSEGISVVFLPELSLETNFVDSTICAGASVLLSASGCKASLKWSTGGTTPSITISPESSVSVKVTCKNTCDSVNKTFNINVVPGISAPAISVNQTRFCPEDTISISATGCDGQVVWSNNFTGNNLKLPAESSFSISAHCVSLNCSSPESNQLNISVLPQISAGTIQDYTQTNCAGFNPATINSLTNPSGGTIQWQFSENCSAVSPVWVDISGAHTTTYNPPALNVTSCFRRMVFDSCQTVFSNVVTFHIVPDPVISVSSDLAEVCFGNSVLLKKTTVGGQGTCLVQWQINKVTGAASSAFWKNYALGDSLEIPNQNIGSDSTWYFRARVDCENSSCNLAVSEGVSVVFHPELSLESNFTDSTICAGASVLLSASGCKASLKWSTGETTPSITISPEISVSVKVTCKNTCDSISKTFNINVVPGISAPIVTVNKTSFCYGDTISISATGCDGQVVWSNDFIGSTQKIIAQTSFVISAHCQSQNCNSPESNQLNISVLPQISAGTIQDYTQTNCSGFNPATINSLSNPSGGTIRWQFSENCAAVSPGWVDILGANTTTYNPSALNVTTCFRRMIFDSCQTVFSNIVTFHIVPDPVVSVSSDLSQVCFGNSVLLSKNIIGGQGSCPVQWQINKVSGAASSAFWQNYALGDSLEIPNQNPGSDSTWYFRVRVDCENSSCNLAVSEGIPVVFHPQLNLETNFVDSTICAGASVLLSASGCKASLKWSTGETTPSITTSPQSSVSVKVICKNTCDSISKTFNINVVPGISAPIITVNKTSFCYGDTISISASGCDGQVIWSNNFIGSTQKIIAQTSFVISAHCQSQNCNSPESNQLNISVLPQISAGTIQDYTQTNCSGFNPATINSLTNPTGGTIQWQFSENCSTVSPVWADISGANTATYNPPALNVTTCFRRMVFDSCQTAFSNVVTFHIVPDPVVSVSSDLAEVCFGNSVLLSKNIIGGQGTCPVQWQINKVSGAASSAFWQNYALGDSLEIPNQNVGSDSTLYFRVKVDCDNASCNLAVSEGISVVFHPELSLETNFVDSTICASASVLLSASGCKASLKWSTGGTTPSITISPQSSVSVKVICKNTCDSISKTFNINVVPGISAPINVTDDSIFAPQTLEFSAIGQNLKWFLDSTSHNFSLNAPEYSLPGKYTVWVSQTIGQCESPRLKISSTIFAALAIISQPVNQLNCNGNTSNFTVNASGSGILNYQWFRKRPGELQFSSLNDDLPNIDKSTTNQLKISNIGNIENPNGTLYYCKIEDSFSEIFSDSVLLNVNKLSGTLDNQEKCLTQTFDLNLAVSHQISGDPISVQWQYRTATGTEWDTLYNNSNVSGSESTHLQISSLHVENAGQYRCALKFASSSGTCIETTDLMTLKVRAYPTEPVISQAQVCQNEKLEPIEINHDSDLDVLWFTTSENGFTYKKQPGIDTETPGEQALWCSLVNDYGCESNRVKVPITVHPQPNPPINITPNIQEEGTPLVFKAEGDNLKWYTSRTGKTFTTQNPEFTKVGKHDYYVSQTNAFGCESDRLLIVAEIVEAFGILTQPVNQTNCEGNTVTFSIKLKGETNPSYQWQIKNRVSGQFENLEGKNSIGLKIENAGEKPFTDGSVFRCIIKENQKELISNEATLKVNSISGKINDVLVCENTGINPKKAGIQIDGKIKTIEWQQKTGNIYNTLFSVIDSTASFFPEIKNTDNFRIRVTFQNVGTSTCIRSTPDFKITVNPKPEKPVWRISEVCQFDDWSVITKDLPKSYQYFDLDTLQLSKPNLDKAGETSFLIKNISANNCNSDFLKTKITIRNAPVFALKDTTITFCSFSESQKDLQLLDKTTRWYQDLESDFLSENTLNLDSKTENQSFFARVQGENSCFSKPIKVGFDFIPCYQGKSTLDTCLSIQQTNLNPNDWNYFYQKNGKILAAIHPVGQNMGLVSLDFGLSSQNFISILGESHLLPKYLNLKTSRSISKPIKIRTYFSKNEILNFPIQNLDSVWIINYSGSNSDCNSNNNSDENQYKIIGNSIIRNTENQEFKYLEFATMNLGEYGFWGNNLVLPELQGLINNNGNPQVSIRNFPEHGKTIIQKSNDGKNWADWISDQNTAIDLRPFSGKNQYQLVYIFENGLKITLNKIGLEYLEAGSKCVVFENPTINQGYINLYFNQLDKNTLIFNDLNGQIIEINKITDKNDHFRIEFKNPLHTGTYFIFAKNKNGEACSQKIFVR
ncbi:MAG: hypothetical protein LCH67_07745 [Bacteroidetes bacterium]|nr:hypothetical protein [Bacteroidota bacterium]